MKKLFGILSNKRKQLFEQSGERGNKHALMLMAYDAVLLIAVYFFILVLHPSNTEALSIHGLIIQVHMSAILLFSCRIFGGIYNHVWRYGRTTLYIRLILADAVAGLLYYAAQLLFANEKITLIRAVSIMSINLLLTISIRLVYQYLYDYNSTGSRIANVLRKVAAFFIGMQINPDPKGNVPSSEARSNIAIVGAGRVGAMLAEELLHNPNAFYNPCFFIETDKEKVGRYINDRRVYSEREVTPELISRFQIQEIVFAVPSMDYDRKMKLYQKYKDKGCRIKVYDYPTARNIESGKRNLREFDIQELLFRQLRSLADKRTSTYYQDKVILITGGGGSIGSELCRQVAKMQPKRIVILDIYENGAYDIQQELLLLYNSDIDLSVEIASVCDRTLLEKVFQTYRPNVVLHAAAHKHVPLMEHNCSEAVKNNVFGTLNTVELAEQYSVEKFIMISTDKAVNPTSVMGATKRMCEMIVQSRTSSTIFIAVRFGNVLGSNGSVIPLFKRQIENGGPVTITDKRIIRYFMTIPEAAQLVLTSGSMAKNGETCVLDMGQPIKILELAENMIRLSGFEPYKEIKIVETGLRPGEKLYEELLIDSDSLETTENKLIYIERNHRVTKDFVSDAINRLDLALEKNDPQVIRDSLMSIVETYHPPEEVNSGSGFEEEPDKYKIRMEQHPQAIAR